MSKNVYFNINDLEDKNIHFNIGGKGYGKVYHEQRKYIENKLKGYKKEYIDSINNIKMINNWKEETYPPVYYMNKGIVDFIDYFIKELEGGGSNE